LEISNTEGVLQELVMAYITQH